MSGRAFASFAWTAVSFALLLLTLLLALAVLAVPRSLGAVPLTILTGSMEPAMPPGTLAIVRPVDASQVDVGDVVTYQWASDDPALVTHRVTELAHTSDGSTFLTLQGDNNNHEDPPVVPEQVMGEVVYAVPYFGWLTNKLNTGKGPEYTHYAAYAFLGYSALTFAAGLGSAVRGRRRAPRAEADPAPGRHRGSPARIPRRSARRPRPSTIPRGVAALG